MKRLTQAQLMEAYQKHFDEEVAPILRDEIAKMVDSYNGRDVSLNNVVSLSVEIAGRISYMVGQAVAEAMISTIAENNKALAEND